MGAGLGSCFQWIFGENPDQRKAPLTVEMEDGPVGREVASLLHCGVSWGRSSPNLNKLVNRVTQHLVLYCEQSGLQPREGGSGDSTLMKRHCSGGNGKRCFIDPLRA